MAQVAEVEFSLPSKRPRLDLRRNGHHDGVEIGKVTTTDAKDSGTESKYDPCTERKGNLVSIQNGVGKTVMAEGDFPGLCKDETNGSNHVKEADDEVEDDRNEAGDENGVDSDSSDMSGLSEHAWRPVSGPMAWVQQQMLAGRDPRTIIRGLIPNPNMIPQDIDDFTLWKIIVNLLSEPERRKKLKHINTIDDVVNLMKTCKNIMVLTGAGVSVSCGIPDFRSRDGVYARLAIDFPDLPDPQSMFDIQYFRHDPRPFFKFAKEIYPGQFEPSRCHKFIRLIERQGKLLRNYTQNIDTLEQVAGINNVIQCHGSFAGATCMVCKHKVDAEDLREDIFQQVIPHCPVCPSSDTDAIMKPDIVFFGESLPEKFHRQMAADKDVCDLLIVIGSSLKVRPVALIPDSLPASVPQILINRERLPHLNFDVELLGDSDVVISELCQRLGEDWSHMAYDHAPLSEVQKGELVTPEMSDEEAPQDSPMSTNTVSENSSTSMPLLGDSNSNISMQDSQEEVHSKLGQSKGKDSSMIETKGDNSIPSDSSSHSGESVTTTSHDLKVSETLPSEASNTSSREQGDTSVSDNTTANRCPTNNVNRSSTSCIRRWWQSRHKSMASQISDVQFLHVPPNRYIFKGAEVYTDSDSDPGNDDDDDSSLSDGCASDQGTGCGDADRKMDNGVLSQSKSESSDNCEAGKTEDLKDQVRNNVQHSVQAYHGATSPGSVSAGETRRTDENYSDAFGSRGGEISTIKI